MKYRIFFTANDTFQVKYRTEMIAVVGTESYYIDFLRETT